MVPIGFKTLPPILNIMYCAQPSRMTCDTNHVTGVAKYAKDTYSVTPIIWDDMLRNLMVEEMAGLADLVEPMVWVYAPDVERFAPSYTWDRFNQVFPNMWTASAFKGAHGETLVVPDIQKHLDVLESTAAKLLFLSSFVFILY